MLLEPIAAEAPCGESLEDTQLLASFDTYRVFGQATPLDPQPEWLEIKSKAIEALARSKDLRVLAHLGTALLRTDGVPAFSDTLDVAAKWLELWWSQTHPLVTEDPILRRNALNCFADQMAVIDGLRRTPLVVSRVHGSFSLRDIDIATGQVPPRDGDPRPTEEQIAAAFSQMPAEDLVRLHESVTRGLAAVRSIDGSMRDAAGSDATPTFDPLSAQLARMAKVLTPYVARVTGASADGAQGATVGEAPASQGALGPIRSRQDAIAALDAVADFFRRTEPSSPVPMFLARAKRLVSKDFLEVLADVAPDAVAQARLAGGVRDGE